MPDLIAPTAWSAPAIATTLRKTIKLKRAKQANSLRARRNHPGSGLRRGRHAPIASHGHPRQAHRPGLALAERLRRKVDRIDPTRVCRPHGCLGRSAPAPDSDEVFRLLQRVEDSSVSRQRRSDPSRNPARGPRHISARPRRASSPLLQNLIFGTDRRVARRFSFPAALLGYQGDLWSVLAAGAVQAADAQCCGRRRAR